MLSRIEEAEITLQNRLDLVRQGGAQSLSEQEDEQVYKPLLEECQKLEKQFRQWDEDLEAKLPLYGYLYLISKAISERSVIISGKIESYENEAEKLPLKIRSAFFQSPLYLNNQKKTLENKLEKLLQDVTDLDPAKCWEQEDGNGDYSDRKVFFETLGSISIAQQALSQDVQRLLGLEQDKLNNYGRLYLIGQALIPKIFQMETLERQRQEPLEKKLTDVTYYLERLQEKAIYFEKESQKWNEAHPIGNSAYTSINKFSIAKQKVDKICAQVENLCQSYLTQDPNAEALAQQLKNQVNNVYDSLNEHRGELKLILCNLLYAIGTLFIGYAIHAIIAESWTPLRPNTDTANILDDLTTAGTAMCQ